MKKILAKLLNGEISIEGAEGEILNEFFSVSTFASLDINREMRSGIPEVVYAEDKSPDVFFEIVTHS
jgi:NCAIR mutase (PurE)-related proteins